MGVVDARIDLVRVLEVIKSVEQFHIGARGLDGDDVGVHVGYVLICIQK